MTQNDNQGGTPQETGKPDKPQVKPPVITPDPVIQGHETKGNKNREIDQKIPKS